MLGLLHKLEAILQRESLQGDLSEKYSAIFNTYGIELDDVENLYDKQKLNPPMPRNAPPVAGNIMWARQLLTRVEEPMQVRFSGSKASHVGCTAFLRNLEDLMQVRSSGSEAMSCGLCSSLQMWKIRCMLGSVCCTCLGLCHLLTASTVCFQHPQGGL